MFNAKRDTNKSKGDLNKTYSGPYSVEEVNGKCVRLATKEGKHLKKIVNINHIKPYYEEVTRETEVTATEETLEIPVQTYVKRLAEEGILERLGHLMKNEELPRSASLQRHSFLMTNCPVYSFVNKMEKDCSEDMEDMARVILPYLRTEPVSISKKTAMTVLMASICCLSFKHHEPPLTIATTLMATPAHLSEVTVFTGELLPEEKLNVGGETLGLEDLDTLQDNHWINDKVVNAFLNAQKLSRNMGDTHVLVLPSYLASLWLKGNFGNWLFLKVNLSQFETVVLPICHENHWILLVAFPRAGLVHIYDSLHGNNQKYFELWM